jgi:hypothetical protein
MPRTKWINESDFIKKNLPSLKVDAITSVVNINDHLLHHLMYVFIYHPVFMLHLSISEQGILCK